MYDWILFTLAPMIIMGMIAVVVAGALAICAGLNNRANRREAAAAAEAAQVAAEVAAE